jgi:hypothetical protein
MTSYDPSADDGGFSLDPGVPRSRLGAVFGGPPAAAAPANASLQYKAPPQPKPTAAPALIFALPINLLK